MICRASPHSLLLDADVRNSHRNFRSLPCPNQLPSGERGNMISAFYILVILTSWSCEKSGIFIHGLDSSTYGGLNLSADGSYQATQLTESVSVRASCRVGSFTDFYMDVEESHLHENLFMHAVYIPDASSPRVVDPSALSLHVYYARIPSDRSTDWVRMSSPDGLYSWAIDANELKVGRYFISVKCGDLADADFTIVAVYQPSDIIEHTSREFTICGKETLYHHMDVSAQIISSRMHARFKICVAKDSLSQFSMVVKVWANHSIVVDSTPSSDFSFFLIR